MLHFRSHRQIASSETLERERRLLWVDQPANQEQSSGNEADNVRRDVLEKIQDFNARYSAFSGMPIKRFEDIQEVVHEDLLLSFRALAKTTQRYGDYAKEIADFTAQSRLNAQTIQQLIEVLTILQDWRRGDLQPNALVLELRRYAWEMPHTPAQIVLASTADKLETWLAAHPTDLDQWEKDRTYRINTIIDAQTSVGPLRDLGNVILDTGKTLKEETESRLNDVFDLYKQIDQEVTSIENEKQKVSTLTDTTRTGALNASLDVVLAYTKLYAPSQVVNVEKDHNGRKSKMTYRNGLLKTLVEWNNGALSPDEFWNRISAAKNAVSNDMLVGNQEWIEEMNQMMDMANTVKNKGNAELGGRTWGTLQPRERNAIIRNLKTDTKPLHDMLAVAEQTMTQNEQYTTERSNAFKKKKDTEEGVQPEGEEAKREADKEKKEMEPSVAPATVMETCDETLRGIDKTKLAIASMKEMFSLIDNAELKKKMMKEVAEVESEIGSTVAYIRTVRGRAEMLHAWYAVQKSPDELREYLRAMKRDNFDEFDIVLAETETSMGKNWDAMDEKEKEKTVGRLQRTLTGNVISSILATDNDDIGSRKNALETINGFADNFRKNLEEQEKTKKQGKKEGSSIRLHFYSIMDIWDSLKQVGAAYKNVYDQYLQRKRGLLAKQIAGVTTTVMPYYGADVMRSVDSVVTQNDNKQMKDYQEYLEGKGFSFTDMFGPGGEFESNKRDGNRFRACLEYAAKYGWLYNIDLANANVMGYDLQPGTTLPPTWTEADMKLYFRDLDTKNKSGESSQRKEGTDRSATLDDIPEYVSLLKEELENQNLWAALGVVEKALDRGKKGECSTWMAVTVATFLRENKIAQKHLSKGWLDAFGKALGMPIFATAYLKLDKNALKEWAEKGGDPNTFSQAGALAKVMTAIEKEIDRIHTASGRPALQKNERERLVARVLAGQVIKENGWKEGLSIFNNVEEFNGWRKMLLNLEDAQSDVKSVDPDYFSPTMGSEMILVNGKSVARIIAVTSTNTLEFGTNAQKFLGQIITRYDQLKKNKMHAAAEQFREEIDEKFYSAFLQTERLVTLVKQPAPVAAIKTNGEVDRDNVKDETSAIVAMVERGLISNNTLKKLRRSQMGETDKFVAEIEKIAKITVQ